MAIPSNDSSLLLSVAHYVVEAHCVRPAPVDVLNWAQPLVAAAAAAAAITAAAAATALGTTDSSPTPKTKRKAKTTKTDPLLLPVDAVAPAPAPAPAPTVTAAPAQAPVPTADDPLKNHKYRIASINPALCQARKRGDAIPGTNPKDAGYVKKFYVETQCAKPPAPGQAMCKTCIKMEIEKSKYWQGRLDQPLVSNADVVGCASFFDAYPKGLMNDPTTAPPTPALLVNTKKGAKAKTKAVVAAPTSTVPESVAVTDSDVPDVEWEQMFYQGKPHIRNLKTHMVYEVDPHKSALHEMVRKDRCVGKWIADRGTIDPYAVDEDEDEDDEE